MTDFHQNESTELRILLIDDEQDFVDTLADSLRLNGYRVATALSAAEAVAGLDAFQPDIALVDIRLGVDDGLELVQKFLTIAPELICIMVTAYSDTNSAIRALQSGAYDFLSKPFRLEELLAVVHRCAEKSRLVRERQAAIQALTEREEHFRTIFHSAPVAMGLLDASDMIFEDINAQALKLFKLEREQFCGKPAAGLALWKDAEQRSRFYQLLEKHGLATNIEAELTNAAGEDLTCLVSANSIYFHGKMFFIVTVKDITEISRASESLRQSENNYRKLSLQFKTLLDGITDTLLLMSKDCKVIWGNRGATEHFGRSEEALVGAGCQDLWNNDSESCHDCIKAVFKTGTAQELMLKTPDSKTWGIKSFPIKSAEGEIESVIQIISDLTEKVRLREEAARQGHLAALGELAAGVAHEINNPTGMIIRSIPMIQDALKDAAPILDQYFTANGDFSFAGLPYSEMKGQIKVLANDVQDCSMRIKGIVDDLKDFSRPQGDSDAGGFDLGTVVEKASRLLHNQIKKSTDNYIVDIANDMPLTLGQSQRIEQVVLNLIQNACLALDDRNASVQVRVYFDVDKQKNVVEVKDQGKGIEAEDLKHIQEPFFTTRREDGGSGLGLSVSSRIISDHNGLLDIESKPGEGSLFRVLLPIIES